MTSNLLPVLRILRSDAAKAFDLPAYESAGAAGFDLRSTIAYELKPGERQLIPTGLTVELPPKTEMQIRPRSGIAYKHGVTVLNSPGTIDEDYRGEIKVLLINLGQQPFAIEAGMRIAQAVVAPVQQVSVYEVEAVSDTVRGANGFGSSGV